MILENEDWFDAATELALHDIEASESEEEKKHWLKEHLKIAYKEGMHKEIVLKALENNNENI